MLKLPTAGECAKKLITSTVFRYNQKDYEWLEADGICVIRESDLKKLLETEEAYDRLISYADTVRSKEPTKSVRADSFLKEFLGWAKESGDPTYASLLDEYNRRKKEKEERVKKYSAQLKKQSNPTGEDNG